MHGLQVKLPTINLAAVLHMHDLKVISFQDQGLGNNMQI